MKFSEWLVKIEEGPQRQRGYDANVITTSASGPFARHGSPGTQLPISRTWDNRATASVIDAIGTSRADNRRDMGFDVRPTSRIERFPSESQPYMEARYMALQYPQGWGGHRMFGRGLVNSIRSMCPFPSKDPKVWKIDERMQIINEPKPEDAFKLYVFRKGSREDIGNLDSAINFTKALMNLDMIRSLEAYQNVLNLEKPRIVEERTMRYPMPGSSNAFYKVLFCSFVIDKKYKDDDFVGQEIDDIEMGQGEEDRESSKPAVKKPQTGRTIQMRNPSRPYRGR